MNYYSSLVKQIDQLKAQGKEVKLTKLPSVVNIKRKSIRFWFLTTTTHHLSFLIMYDLQEMFNASVLMNKEAIQDEAVMNVLTNASNNNFEFKNVSQDHVTFDEFIGRG